MYFPELDCIYDVHGKEMYEIDHQKKKQVEHRSIELLIKQPRVNLPKIDLPGSTKNSKDNNKSTRTANKPVIDQKKSPSPRRLRSKSRAAGDFVKF